YPLSYYTPPPPPSPLLPYTTLFRSEGLHPAHAGRGRLPHPERSVERAADLAPARGSRAGPYPRLLSRLRAVEMLGDVAEPREPRKLPAHNTRRARAHSVARRRAAHRSSPPDPTTFCHP